MNVSDIFAFEPAVKSKYVPGQVFNIMSMDLVIYNLEHLKFGFNAEVTYYQILKFGFNAEGHRGELLPLFEVRRSRKVQGGGLEDDESSRPRGVACLACVLFYAYSVSMVEGEFGQST